MLTPERRARIEQVVSERSTSIIPVCEDLFDRGNVSAVLRSAEAFGLGEVHLIQTHEKFKESQRTTAGADKWLEIRQWKKTRDCILHLKERGYQIVATHLAPKSVPLHDLDFSQPTAIVLGNEKEGVSPELVALADHCAIIPMRGFVQSFNISVAASLSFYVASRQREQKRGRFGDLSPEHQERLKATFALRTLDSGVATLQRLHEEGKLT